MTELATCWQVRSPRCQNHSPVTGVAAACAACYQWLCVEGAMPSVGSVMHRLSLKLCVVAVRVGGSCISGCW